MGRNCKLKDLNDLNSNTQYVDIHITITLRNPRILTSYQVDGSSEQWEGVIYFNLLPPYKQLQAIMFFPATIKYFIFNPYSPVTNFLQK